MTSSKYITKKVTLSLYSVRRLPYTIIISCSLTTRQIENILVFFESVSFIELLAMFNLYKIGRDFKKFSLDKFPTHPVLAVLGKTMFDFTFSYTYFYHKIVRINIPQGLSSC